MVRNYFLRKGNAMDSNVFDVIIVGAGLAGLSAAVTFIDANITNILILEGWFQLGFFKVKDPPGITCDSSCGFLVEFFLEGFLVEGFHCLQRYLKR